jgi:hypothetical protein
LTLSIAHRGECGVAIARRGPCGIDVEEIAERPRSTVEASCGADELALLDAKSADGDGRDTWFTRFWAAKEAVAKLRGTGLRGRPSDYRVTAADPRLLHVRYRDGGGDGADRGDGDDGDTVYQVHVRETENPPGLPERRYVVAWTAADEESGTGVAR